jgi:hypothetical protein
VGHAAGPWLPSLSIAANLFLIGSLGKDAFIHFGVITAIMVVYYLFISLHATYDIGHDAFHEEDDDEEKLAVEETSVDNGR